MDFKWPPKRKPGVSFHVPLKSAVLIDVSGKPVKDVFLNAAAFDFSATFFRPRGLDNANGKVLINGIEMNKQFNGRPQWGDWGGLNDVQRNREFSMGLKASNFFSKSPVTPILALKLSVAMFVNCCTQ